MAPNPPPAAPNNNGKRKRPPQQQQESSRKRGRVQFHDARAISAQTAGKAFGNGEIDVDKFVKAREFEINALEQGMRAARNILSQRAFQSVPRELRRRTASHNVKRVPKRLRARAVREMKEDNTPTVISRRRKPKPHMRLRVDVARRLKELHAKKKSFKKKLDSGDSTAGAPGKEVAGETQKMQETTSGLVVSREPRIKKNTLQKPPKPKAKFRKRQLHKAWLPTHLFHAKRAHMTPPKEPLWRMAIPLSPTAKSYRPTHRATALRGAVAWDMSYMSTIGLEGPEKSIVGLLKALGLGKDEAAGFWEKRALRWLRGSRHWNGWLYERDEWPSKSIAPATVIWCASEKAASADKMEMDTPNTKQKPEKRKALIRVHPSAFLQLWEELLRLSKIQKPAVLMEDLRFEIGSIELVGPASCEALSGVLWPSMSDETTSDECAENIWPLLRNIASPANLPANALLSLNVTDPRLHQGVQAKREVQDADAQNRLLQLLAIWPLDKFVPVADIFNRTARLAASRRLPSQKAINRRKSLGEPGQPISASPSDPQIPILLLASQGQHVGSGRWILLMPWKCVLSVWYSLMHYPLSAGGTIRFGGLDQLRQTAFEAGVPWFPADHPGTKAGMSWEEREREKRKAAWERRPKGRRIEFETLKLGKDRVGEVGMGWACDWGRLAPKKLDSDGAQQDLHRVPSAMATRLLSEARIDKSTILPKPPDPETVRPAIEAGLITAKIMLVGRGVPTTCARIYRLPMENDNLREQWLSLLPRTKGTRAQQAFQKPPKNAPAHILRQHLAKILLDPPSVLGGDRPESPETPDEQDLIGFITTGNFNLNEGKGTGLGCILLEKAMEYRRWRARVHGDDARADGQICIVREAGQVLGRLARWEVA